MFYSRPEKLTRMENFASVPHLIFFCFDKYQTHWYLFLIVKISYQLHT